MDKTGLDEVSLRSLAAQNFQKAVENINSCSNPDEASWLMVKTRISVDTLSIKKQKAYILNEHRTEQKNAMERKIR